MIPLADIAHEVADRLDRIADALEGLLRLHSPSPTPLDTSRLMTRPFPRHPAPPQPSPRKSPGDRWAVVAGRGEGVPGPSRGPPGLRINGVLH